jgi:hypothetical protein
MKFRSVLLAVNRHGQTWPSRDAVMYVICNEFWRFLPRESFHNLRNFVQKYMQVCKYIHL